MSQQLPDPTALKRRIELADQHLGERFWKGEDASSLVTERSRFIDGFLAEIWQHWFEYNEDFALLAVGGYGRGELHPKSDIDLLILVKHANTITEEIEVFVRLLWDLKLDIGHSVRTIRDCAREAANDITVATALYERRRLAGSEVLCGKLDKTLAKKSIWPSRKFFIAKREEQLERHSQFNDVDYDLEPNIKRAPGGLRDIQTINWITQRHHGTSDFAELTRHGFLTPQERTWLIDGQKFLFKVRFGLHLLANRKEDRLLFDYQRELARRFDYQDNGGQLDVEHFMHNYYQHVLALREVNDILLQHFDEAILHIRKRPQIEPINSRFQVKNNYIETTSPRVFRETPSALLEIFLIMANRRDIAGVRAATIRQIRDDIDLIDETFRHDPNVTRLFIDLLRAPYTLVSQLTRMRRYGVLGRYIPEYGRIVGQMQHDLFHIYTVDQHTMIVLRNMRQFHYQSSQERFPVASHCVKNVPKIELLYIAGLFHDIGKGRGGNHSEHGASDVVAFCQRHCLDDEDTALVEYLVRYHLLMSTTAQRRDIYDPDIIHEFATHVCTETRLDYLYALTVADINATNPTLWNSWRATLMRQLYNETRKTLRRGLSMPRHREDHIDTRKEAALEQLEERGISNNQVLALWDKPDDEFFLRHTTMQLVSITTSIHKHKINDGPLVLLLDLVGQVRAEGATEIFVYTSDQLNLFAASVVALSEMNLQVLDASINTSSSGLCFNSYVVLDRDNRPIGRDGVQRQRIRTTLARELATSNLRETKEPSRISRRLKQFITNTDVSLTTPPSALYSVLQVISSDRPGLLARLGMLFALLGITVHRARITTLGERVEDVFQINKITDPKEIDRICKTIEAQLDLEVSESAA